MALIETEAVILKTLRLGEADKLVTLLTEKRGLVKAVAKGARRPRSRYGSALEPFTVCRVVLFEKRPTILLRMSSAEITSTNRKIRETIQQIEAASKMVRFLLFLLPEDEPSRKTYELLKNGLRQAQRETDLEWLLCIFEFRCLKYAGFHPRLESCLKCGGASPQERAHFSAKDGGIFCGKCVGSLNAPTITLSPGTLSVIRLTEQLNWDGLFRIRLNPPIRSEIQNFLENHLTHTLGLPFPTRINTSI